MTAKRSTLLIPSGPARDPGRRHLFIVLTNTCDQGCQLLVSLSTYYDDDTCDETCILSPGDHPFIQRATFVEYRKARIQETAGLLRGIRDQKLIPHQPVDEDMFEEVCEGLLASIFTPRKIFTYFERYRYYGDVPDPEPAPPEK